MDYTNINVKNIEDIYKCAHGSYQSDLLNGNQSWSGSTLKGVAKRYSSKYATSRLSLVDRLSQAGFDVRLVKVRKNKSGKWNVSNNGRIVCFIGKLPNNDLGRHILAQEKNHYVLT